MGADLKQGANQLAVFQVISSLLTTRRKTRLGSIRFEDLSVRTYVLIMLCHRTYVRENPCKTRVLGDMVFFSINCPSSFVGGFLANFC